MGVVLSGSRLVIATKALLPAPTTYDSVFSYGVTSYGSVWSVADSLGNRNDNLPVFARVFDGGLYTYTGDLTTSDSGPNTGWELPTLVQIKRSASTWVNLTGSYYVSTSTTLNTTTTSSVSDKLAISITNNTDNAYHFTLDNDSSSSSYRTFEVRYDGQFFYRSTINGTDLTSYYIPPKTTFSLNMQSTSLSIYTDAMYLRNLGLPNEDVIADALEDGYNDGYDDGFDNGTSIGYDNGYIDGFNESGGGQYSGAIGLFRGLFSSVVSVFSIEILGPGITIGTLTLFPLLAGVFIFFKKVVQ